MPAWTPVAGGLLLSVRVTPKGGRDRIDGLVTDANGRDLLAVRVSVPPADGAANTAVLALVADAAGVPKRDVTLASGPTSRVKRLRIEGDAATLAACLERLTKDSA